MLLHYDLKEAGRETRCMEPCPYVYHYLKVAGAILNSTGYCTTVPRTPAGVVELALSCSSVPQSGQLVGMD